MIPKAIKREPRILPWYPEWTRRAECAKYPLEYVDLVFFDYQNRSRLIREAKAICAVCPVIRNCYKQNRYVPLGIFYGMTAIERWRANGGKGYPIGNKVGWDSWPKLLAKQMAN